MFDFKEELAKYRESLAAEDLSGGVSGDEVRDILDIAKELVNARGVYGIDWEQVRLEEAAAARRETEIEEEPAAEEPAGAVEIPVPERAVSENPVPEEEEEI